MPDWKIHLIFGCLLTIVFLSIVYFLKIQIDILNIFVMSILILFTSVIPDIDLSKSKVRDLVSLILSFVISSAYIVFYPSKWYYSLAFFLILYFLLKNLKTRHRGLSHTLKVSFLFSFFVILIFYFLLKLNVIECLILFTITFFSYTFHLFLDRL